MSVEDVFNPYPEIQPRLYETWNSGFRVGLETTQGDVDDHMPGLSYPFVYECSNCARETTVMRADAQ